MFVFYLSICCSSKKDKTGQSAKAFLHQFLCSHIFLFCLFYLPSTTILPSSQCPATRQHRFIFASVSIHLYVRTYTRLQYCISTYINIYVRTNTRLTYRISTQCLQCGATRAGDQAVRQLTAFKSVSPTGLKASSQATAKSETGKLTVLAPPCFTFELSKLQNIFPRPPCKMWRKKFNWIRGCWRIFEYQYSDNGIRSRTRGPEGQQVPAVPHTRGLKSSNKNTKIQKYKNTKIQKYKNIHLLMINTEI